MLLPSRFGLRQVSFAGVVLSAGRGEVRDEGIKSTKVARKILVKSILFGSFQSEKKCVREDGLTAVSVSV